MSSDRDTVRSIEAHFSGLGADYDESAFATPGQQWISDRELDAIRRATSDLPRSSRALDAGCGNGRISALLAEKPGAQITALDPVAEMLRTAAARVSGLTAVQARLGDPLPFRSATFDAVVATRVLKWVPDWQAALLELARVVRPGGRIIIEVTNRNSLARLGYHGAPITLLSTAEIRDAGTVAGIAWHDVFAGSHLPYQLWKNARSTRLVRSAARMQHACDRVLGAHGARSLTLVGTRRAPWD